MLYLTLFQQRESPAIYGGNETSLRVVAGEKKEKLSFSRWCQAVGFTLASRTTKSRTLALIFELFFITLFGLKTTFY